MYHAMVYLTRLKSKPIQDFRKKYDPTFDLIDDHLSIIFPVPDQISGEHIIEHTEFILSGWSPFKVHVNNYHLNWDHWLFLTLGEGNQEVIRLYEDMYTGSLRPYPRPDLFMPHISIGYLGKGQFDLIDPDDE